jgi:hypothetical protein
VEANRIAHLWAEYAQVLYAYNEDGPPTADGFRAFMLIWYGVDILPEKVRVLSYRIDQTFDDNIPAVHITNKRDNIPSVHIQDRTPSVHIHHERHVSFQAR